MVNSKVLIFTVVLVYFKGCNSVTISDDDYKKLPVLFELDDYDKCKDANNLFCKVRFKVHPKDAENNAVWKTIIELRKDIQYFRYDVLYRGRCLSNLLYGNEDELIKNVISIENNQLQNISLKADVKKISCRTFGKTLSTYDFTVLILVASYLTMLIYATYLDVQLRKAGCKERNGFVTYLSILSNWELLKKPINNENYRRLKSFEGVRTYNLVLVITAHVIFVITTSFLSDPKYIEDTLYRPKDRPIVFALSNLVQTNFLLSGWLFALHVHEEMENKTELSFAYVVKKIFSRYKRFFPALAGTLLLQKSSWFNYFFDSPHDDYAEANYNACQTNWWPSLFLVTNWQPIYYTCNPVIWSTSNDLQMYALSMVIFYLIYKYKLGLKVFGFMFAACWSIQAYYIYAYNLDMSLQLVPKYLMQEIFKEFFVFALHTSFYSNFGGYFVGIILGTFYYKYRHKTINANVFITSLWFLLFFGIPIFVGTIQTLEFAPVTRGIIGASLKPVFAFGIGVGLMGMTFQVGGFVKKICEWKFAIFLAQFSYSTYISHFMLVMIRLERGLVEVSNLTMVKFLVADIILSFLLGFVWHLVIQQPIINIINRSEKRNSGKTKIA